jgi:S1-C subfamily serine protease
MRNTGLNRWIAIGLALLLSLSACAPLSSTIDQIASPKSATQAVSIARQLVSTIGEAETVVPVVQQATPEIEAETPVVVESVVTLQETLTALYRKANPSVVYIIVTSGGTGLSASGGSGSGFIYDAEGHIVTNNHVIAAGSTYEVVFSDGARLRAELVGTDPDSDLAVLKVEALPDGVVPIPLSNRAVEVGQFAVAIGNPFGEQGSMSLGIISGLGRSLRSQRTPSLGGTTYSLPQVIQTDAPINPGNSGGPLLNLDGEVIGVNAAIASTSGVNSGVGFSIPVDVVKRVVPSLIEDGEVVYPYMGVSFAGEISLADMERYGLTQTQGAYVISVAPDSPAVAAGLIGADPQTGRGGDLIVEIDGQAISNFSDLNTYLVLKAEVGETIEIIVLRGEETATLSLTLGVRP